MAPKNSSPVSRSKKPAFADDYQFADVRLTKADKDAFDAWASQHGGDAFTFLDEVATSSIKASLSWSDSADCYMFSLTDNNPKSPNFHVVLTSRADNSYEAVLMGLYKHYVMLADGRWPVKSEESSWG